MPKQNLPRGFYWRRGRIWCRTDPITGLRRSTGRKSPHAALGWYAERERAAANPADATAHEAPIEDWCEKMLEDKRQRRAAGTVNMYEVKLGHVLRFWGRNAVMADIIPGKVDNFIHQRRNEGAHPSTIGKELTAIVQLCKFAKRGGAYAGDIQALKPVGYSTEYVPRKRVVTRGELRRLQRVMRPEHFAGACLIVVTSARDGEMRHVRLEDYSTERGVLKLRGTKTRRAAREVPILQLFAWEWTFAHAHLSTHGSFSETAIAKSLAYWAAKLGLEHLSPNDLRRTCASRMVSRGIPFDTAAKVLGHSGTQMLFRVYGQLTGEQLRELCDVSVRTGRIDDDDPDAVVAENTPVGARAEALKSPAERCPGSSPGGATSSRNNKEESADAEPPKPAARARLCDATVRDGVFASPGVWALALAAESLGLGAAQ